MAAAGLKINILPVHTQNEDGRPSEGIPRANAVLCKEATGQDTHWVGHSGVPSCLQLGLGQAVNSATVTPTCCSYAVFEAWLSLSLGMHI